MRRLALLVCMLAFAACATTGTPNVPVATFDACASDVIKNNAIPLIPEIARDTLEGDYLAALSALATRVGLPEAECAVQLFVGQMTGKAALDATAALQHQRGQEWLKSQGK